MSPLFVVSAAFIWIGFGFFQLFIFWNVWKRAGEVAAEIGILSVDGRFVRRLILAGVSVANPSVRSALWQMRTYCVLGILPFVVIFMLMMPAALLIVAASCGLMWMIAKPVEGQREVKE